MRRSTINRFIVPAILVAFFGFQASAQADSHEATATEAESPVSEDEYADEELAEEKVEEEPAEEALEEEEFADEDGEELEEEPANTGVQALNAAVDLIIFRPVGVVRLVTGSAIALVSYPASLASDSSAEILESHILDPFDDTFRRPLGDEHGAAASLARVTADIFPVRPISAIRLAVGAAGTAVVYPLAVGGGNGNDVLDSFVKDPFDDLVRPLGDI